MTREQQMELELLRDLYFYVKGHVSPDTYYENYKDVQGAVEKLKDFYRSPTRFLKELDRADNAAWTKANRDEQG